MIIKSISGKTIYRSLCRTVRSALEEGVAKGVDFSGADLRKAALHGACLDGIVAAGADFWAADLTGSDIGLADLRGADLRCALLKDVCLAESNLAGADMAGAFFSGTLLDGAVLDSIRVSCPSFWDLDLSAVRSALGAVYCHKGEEDIAVQPDFCTLRIAGERIVLNGGACLWRGSFYSIAAGDVPALLQNRLSGLHKDLSELLSLPVSRNATKPIPKSGVGKTGL